MTTPAAPPVRDLAPEHVAALKAGLLAEINAPGKVVSPIRRRSVAIPLAAAAAVTAGAYVAVTSLGHGGAVAYAWSPTPAAATSADLHRAVSICRNNYAWAAAGSGPSAAVFARTAGVAVAERRLKTFSIVLSDGHTIATCLLPDPSRPGPVGTTGGFSGPTSELNLTRPAGHLLTLLGGDSETGDGNGHDDHLNRTFIYGRSGPDVRSVVIELDHGRTVTATVSHTGWWEAWYPEKLGPNAIPSSSATVTDANGIAHLEPLHF